MDTRERLTGWRAVIGYGSYPLLFGGGLMATWALMSAGFPKAVSVTGVAIVVGLVVWGFEQLLPYTEKWRANTKTFGQNLFHTLISTGLTTLVLEATILGGFVALGVILTEAIGGGLWPTSWPLALQVLLGLSLGELGAYWVHRICHLSERGWRIHALHHSSEELHFLASGKNHPLNVVATMTLQSILPIAMGVTPETLALMSIFTGINGLMQHANVDFRPGLLNYLVSTSDLHRWHHAKDLDESNTNFGNNLILWDHVFGTFYYPKDRAPTTNAGVEGLRIPATLTAQLASPFLYKRFEVDANGEPLHAEPAPSAPTTAPLTKSIA